MPLMSRAELQGFLDGTFPDSPPPYVIEEVGDWGVTDTAPDHRGPQPARGHGGGAGAHGAWRMQSAWLAILAQIGPVALAVTTSLHIDFLRKPALVDVVAEGRLLKLGRRLGVTDVALRSVGQEELVAKAQVTYSIPPR